MKWVRASNDDHESRLADLASDRERTCAVGYSPDIYVKLENLSLKQIRFEMSDLRGYLER